MTKNNGIASWFRQNAWAIIFFTGVTIAGYATLKAQVNAMEAKLIQYPSMDYFELKFKTVDDKMIELQSQIKDLKLEVRALK